MRRRALKFVIVAGVIVAALTSGFVSLGRIQRETQVGEICAAAGERRWADALALGEGASGPDAGGRAATECLCQAYTALDQPAKCSTLLERVLREPEAADWLPDVALSRLLVRARLDAGDVEEAAAFARRASRRYSNDADVLDLELAARARGEGESKVLAEMRQRVSDANGATFELRIVLAAAYVRRREPLEALTVLGDTPPPAGSPELERWFESRADALASLRDGAGLAQNYARWETLGGNPRELHARLALRQSTWDAVDSAQPQLDRLRSALAEVDALGDDRVQRALYARVLDRLVADGRVEGALEVFDRALDHHPGLFRAREEIQHAAEAGHARTLVPIEPGGTLVFTLAPAANGASGGKSSNARSNEVSRFTLHVSPDRGAPGDTSYESFAISAGQEVRVARQRAPHPVRWVLRASDEATQASGSVWPEPTPQRIEIRPDEGAAPPAEAFDPDPSSGDGRRRVIVVIPACEDWRILQYLRERGEVPVQERALATGHRAVLTSAPAFTGAALESLVWPGRGRTVSFVGLVNRLGMELEDLSAVDANPLGFLQPILPEEEDLFERIGADDHVAANLLFPRADAGHGRVAERIGPFGARRPLATYRAQRDLRVGESADLPRSIGRASDRRVEVAKLAAELDTAVALARADDVDFAVIRLEPLDRLTHALFAEMLEPGQDDGRAALLWVYRYVDGRLGEVWSQLDADDVFVILSDHGIRTPLEHEEDAIFVAVGGGVARGRADGAPQIAGVARYLASLFDIDTTWPETGLGKASLARR